jgi:hypothetical protein
MTSAIRRPFLVLWSDTSMTLPSGNSILAAVT